jgi:hypothetical protein
MSQSSESENLWLRRYIPQLPTVPVSIFLPNLKKNQEIGSTGKNLTKYDLSTGEKARMSSGIHLSANLGNELYTRPAKKHLTDL